jgi:pimeloyl-ACP methyl ester carboxylesterase
MRQLPFFVPVVFLFVTGCGLATVSPAHHIMVHKDGYPINQDRQPLSADEFNEQYLQKILDGIDEYAVRAWNKKTTGNAPGILIDAHGGLNTYSSAFQRAHNFLEAQGDPQRYPNLSSYYLLHINWNASIFSSLWDDLMRIRQGEINSLVAVPTAPGFFVGYTVNSILGAPRSLYSQMDNTLEGFHPEIPGETTGDRILIGAQYFLTYPIRAVTVPFIQGFGTPGWENMKRRDAFVFARILRPYDRYLSPPREYAERGAGRALMEKLKDRIPEQGKWKTENGRVGPMQITLVGHSMGTLVMNHLLEAFPEMYFDRIIYMAAACSIEDFENIVLPYLRMHPDTKFWGFSLAKVDEAREQGVIDLYERGSLLVWIDNLFEDVRTPWQRRFGKARNLERYYKLPPGFDHTRVCIVSYKGRSGEPRKHGDFSKPDLFEKVLGSVSEDKCDGPFIIDP